jgi:uncharacterized membrane protein YgcG
MITMSCTVIVPGKGAPSETALRKFPHNEFLASGANFASGNKEGNRNRVSVGKIMALFRAAGMTEEAITKNFTNPSRQMKAATLMKLVASLQGKEIVVFYEPPGEGDKNTYPTIQYIPPELAEDALSGVFVPKSQRQNSPRTGSGGDGTGGDTGDGGAGGAGDTFNDEDLFGAGGSAGGGASSETGGSDWD